MVSYSIMEHIKFPLVAKQKCDKKKMVSKLNFGIKHGHTFTDFQIYRVVNILDQLLTTASLLEHKSFEVENQHRRQLFEGNSPADLNLRQERKEIKRPLPTHANTHQREPY